MSYSNQVNNSADPNAPTISNTGTRGSDPSYQTPSLTSQEQQIPQTILMDCNRANANLTIDGANSLHKWTCEFAGGIEIKTGDQISVNSAYLNSIGVGDLIAWTKSGEAQDNKCKWLIEYYCSNDGKNDKKEGYNLRYGAGKYPYPYDNKPAELYRYQNKVSYRDEAGARGNSGTDFSYALDPYIQGRFFGLNQVNFKTAHECSGVYIVELFTKPFNQFADNHYVNNPFCLMKFSKHNPDHSTTQLDARQLIPVGTFFNLTNASDPNAVVGQQPVLNNNCLNYKWCCFGIYFEGGVYYAMVEKPPFWTTNGGGLGNADRTITGKITLLGGRGTAGIIRGDLAQNGHGRVFNCNRETDYFKANTYYYLTTNRGNTFTQDLTQPQAIQKIATLGNGKLTKQFAYETGTQLPVVSFNLPQSAFYKNRLLIHSLQITRLAIQEQDYIEFEIQGDYNTGATPQLHSVADLLAKNNGRFNFTFSIARPDGTQELVVAYAHDDPQGTASGSPSRITYVSPNRFIINGGIMRDAENGTTIDRKTGFNPTPSGTNNDNTIFWCGYEQDFNASYDTTGMNQQPFLSSTPFTATQEAGGVNGYPLVNVNEPIQYGLIEVAPENIGIPANQSPDYMGYNYLNLGTTLTNFGKGSITLANGDTQYNNFILLYPQQQSTCEVKHYDFKDFSITDDYSSPSDIATNLTNQAHQIENARDSDGVVIADSKAKGIIQNKFVIPVWTHPSFEEPAGAGQYEMTAPDTSVLGGSYYLQKQIFNYPVSRGTAGHYNFTSGEALPNGLYKIYFRNGNTSINKPYLNNGAQAQGNLGGAGNRDFDVSQAPNGIPKSVGLNPQGQREAYPITYIEGKNCFISQFVGANDLTFSWDDTDSRFAISYIGQVAVDNFDSKTATGGDMSATIYIPNPQGQNGYNFKAPQTRYGGINIVNWCANDLINPSTPAGIQQQLNFTGQPAYTFDAERDEAQGGVGAWFLNLNLNKDPIGNRFWNKLGYSNNQLFTTNVGHSIDGVSGEYIPNGTTDILVDSAGSIITGGEPNENTPIGNAQSNWDGNTDGNNFVAGRTYGGVGGMSFNNHNVGYGIPNTAGRPLSFKQNHITLSQNNPFYDFDSTYNPDREEHTGYTYKSDTALLTADNLPVKTEEAYYYIVSDLVKTDFFVSNDNGFSTSIIGILSKLNSGGDFIYQYQAPQQFYAKRDAIITSITTEILTPKFKPPLSIDAFSSVVYQITRTNTTPNPLQDTPLMIQERYFANLQNYINMTLQNVKKNQQPLTQTGRVQEIMKEISGALVIPDDHQAEIIQRITANYQRLGLARFRNNPTQYRQFLLQDPEAQNFLNDLATLNRIQNRQPQAPMGISDPESINPASIEATILNTTHEPQHAPVYLPPDQHQLALHIVDTLDEAHQRGQQYTQQDLGNLLGSIEGMTPETAQSIHELAQFYLQQDRPVAPEGRPETPIGFDPTRQPQAEFGGATAEQPTLIGTPLPVGLGTLTGIGQRELLEQLGQQNILGLNPERLARMKRSIGSGSSTSGLASGSDTDTITGGSEGTRTTSSGYYSLERRDVSNSTNSDALGRIREAEEEP